MLNNSRPKKILLCLMPFWSPLTPPLGLAVLKSYLAQNGFDVTTYDFNAEKNLWGILNKYFEVLDDVIPEHKRGNFHMVAYDVLSNQLMAYLHKGKSSESKYHELVRLLVEKNFFVKISDEAIIALDKYITEFYSVLRKSILKVFTAVEPDVFGISVYSTSLAPSMFAFKTIKKYYPDVMTIMGGGVFADLLALDSPNIEPFLKTTEAYLDNIIIGEGEILFTKYLQGELQGKRVYTIDDIGRSNVDLSTVNIPDFCDFDPKAYLQMATYSTRSCPFQCNFCSETVQWGRFRKKDTEKIVKEIQALKAQYGSKLFLFGDSLVNQVITPLSKKLVETGLDIYWDGYLRADPEVCDPANTELWRQGGYYRARLGIESGSQHVLDLMNKKTNPNQIRRAITSLAQFGIKTTTYWIVGHPGETEADFQETLNLISEMCEEIYEADWHPFYFFPKGQVSSLKWVTDYGYELLYPAEFAEMLVTQTWVLKTSPSREEIYDRVNRFGEACTKLNIPNPYSLMDIYNADKRWKTLHPAAGPTILELHNQ